MKYAMMYQYGYIWTWYVYCSHIILLISVYFFTRFLLRSLFASPELRMLAAPFQIGLFALLALAFYSASQP
jgi:hypothetical protein